MFFIIIIIVIIIIVIFNYFWFEDDVALYLNRNGVVPTKTLFLQTSYKQSL